MGAMRLKSPSSKSPRTIGGVVWPTLRLVILLFNVLLILNLVFFAAKQEDNTINRKTSTTTSGASRTTSSSSFHQQHERDVLSQCIEEQQKDVEENPFDLRNDRHRNHKSTFEEKVCDALPLGATAASLWNKYADKILEASIHPLDTDQVHAPWTKDLQNLLTPHYLQRAMRSQPSHESLQKVIQIVQNKLQNPDTAPPLHVAVVGGSVTEGGGCDRIPSSVTTKAGAERPVIRGQACSWPFRLQHLVDQFLGQGVIQIHNLAVGGTNSGLAVPVLDYWLFPQNSPLLEHGPDVIINGYAANDNLTPANKRGPDTNMTGDLSFFYSNGIRLSQKFIRTSLLSRPCQNNPLVIYVDEYLGNQHNLILGELFRFEGIDILTNWYANAAAISPAQVVRRLVFGNTHEDLFTANWIDRRGNKKIDVHFGMPGHVHIAWSVAYALLEMTLNFCEEETSRRATTTTTTAGHHHHHHEHVAPKFVPKEALELIEQEIPPSLSATIQVKDVAKKWHDDAVKRKQSLAEYCGSGSSGDTAATAQALPCSLAFVAAPMGTVKNAGALNNYMKPFTVHNDGWSGQQDIRNGWQNKLGYVAMKANATVSLHISETPNKVKTIILHTLKSYGEKWAGSEARFALKWNHNDSGKSYSTSWEILGYHNQNTSIAYPYKLDLGPDHIAEKGSTLDLQIDLIGGTTFKINSMMICSR